MKEVLRDFGFQHDWISWISNLVSTAFFSIIVNGAPTTPFSATRGTRQGDPLSPFLFIILAEGLGRALKEKIQEGKISGLKPHEAMQAQTHQQFVDDTMLMAMASVREAKAIKQTLDAFKRESGLEVKKDKSQIFYFNTPLVTRRNITQILEFVEGSLPSKYLGAPLFEGKVTQKHWKELLDKMASKLNNWTHRSLNFPSRLTLVKSVLQAIPKYIFSVLAAPKNVLKKIRAIQRNFLWGSTEVKQKWALVDWETICKPKRAGGLGLRDPKVMNKVLNAKIWWRWVTNKGEPWTHLWHHKYASGWAKSSLIRWDQSNTGFAIWQAANANKHLVKDYSFWEVGNGEEADFFRDSWQQMPKIHEEIEMPEL